MAQKKDLKTNMFRIELCIFGYYIKKKAKKA